MAAASGYKPLLELFITATPIMNKNVKFKAFYAKYYIMWLHRYSMCNKLTTQLKVCIVYEQMILLYKVHERSTS